MEHLEKNYFSKDSMIRKDFLTLTKTSNSKTDKQVIENSFYHRKIMGKTNDNY